MATVPIHAFAHGMMAECIEKCRKHGLPAPHPDVKVNLRGRSTAGKCIASPITKRIVVVLNPDYYAVQGDDYAQTVAHEYAHAVVFEGRFEGRWINPRPHGREWASVMRVLGYAPERCVSEERARPEAARKTTQYVYACAGCGGTVTMGPQRHAKAREGVKYLHRCTSRVRAIRFTGEVR